MIQAQGTRQHSVAVHFLRLLTDYLESQRLSIDRLLAETGIPAESLNDPNGRVPFDSFSKLCEHASKLLNDPCLGLTLGKNIRPGHLGSHGFALMSCANGLELMRQSRRYSALTIDAAHSEFELKGKEGIRYWRSNLPNMASLGRLQDELNQASSVTLVRYLSNRPDLNPNWVAFRHAKPHDTSPYETLFRCPVYFGATDTAIGFNPEYLNIPLPHANAQLRIIMDDICARLLKELGDALEPVWLSVTRQAVLAAFQQGMPELSSVANVAGMSEDELRDRLGARGVSFRSFVDDLRRGLAMGYARDPNLSLVDIAYLLGFSEQSAFQRAFKRWTGMSPGQYRKTQLIQSP